MTDYDYALRRAVLGDSPQQCQRDFDHWTAEAARALLHFHSLICAMRRDWL